MFKRAVTNDRNQHVRLNTNVTLPEEIQLNGRVLYRNSWIEHLGTGAGNGHYVAYRDDRSIIYQINDTRITEITAARNITSRSVTLVTYRE